MKALRQASHLLGHEPSDRELARLRALNDSEFNAAKAKHLAKRPSPATPETAGIAFVLSLIGAPACFVLGIVEGDLPLLMSSIFWLVVGFILFLYLAFAAGYWREHRAIILEEIRRYGHPSFG